jgi:hypothetical protein
VEGLGVARYPRPSKKAVADGLGHSPNECG